jgi:hypothetical protein
MSKSEDDRKGVSSRVAARRARFRDAVSRLSERAQSTELLRMLLLPGAFAVVAGFVFMFFGWYGASRTPREIEQVPYLISGGLIGLGLVLVGALLLACAFWMSMLQRFSEEADERADARLRELAEGAKLLRSAGGPGGAAPPVKRLGSDPRASRSSTTRAPSRRGRSRRP